MTSFSVCVNGVKSMKHFAFILQCDLLSRQEDEMVAISDKFQEALALYRK